MSALASVVLTTARTLLNDDGAALWTDAVLLPKLAQAHRELQVKLKMSAAPVMKGIYIETLAIGVTAFVTPPSDLIAPIMLWEKLAADPVTSYTQMTETDPLPNAVAASTMIYWAWVQEVVKFIGSTGIRQIKMLYWRSLAVPAAGSDTIGCLNGELYLAPRTAAIATGATGQGTEYQTLTALADSYIAQVITSNRGRAPQQQAPSVKP